MSKLEEIRENLKLLYPNLSYRSKSKVCKDAEIESITFRKIISGERNKADRPSNKALLEKLLNLSVKEVESQVFLLNELLEEVAFNMNSKKA